MKRPAQQQLNDEGNSDDEERTGGKRWSQTGAKRIPLI